MTWQQQLRRASFGGVPFGVLGGELRVGRRNAVHTYPFKDEVWVEDLGRTARRITMVGFLVENGVYGGGSVIDQREQMVAVCESEGPSTLVHPTLGSIQVSLLDSSFRERWDQGRVFEVSFEFIEGGNRQFPAFETSTVDQVLGMCTTADGMAGSDFLSGVLSALSAGAAVVTMAVNTVTAWVGGALALVSDATNLMNTVAVLSGSSYGRFFGTGLRGISGRFTVPFGTPTTITGLVAAGSASRAAVTTACSNLSAAGASLGATTVPAYTAAAQAVTAAVLASTTDPADGIRMLATLATFTPAAPTPSSEVGSAMATVQSASGDLFRRAAVVSVCRAAAKYQPTSYDDAVAVRDRVTALLDAEIQVAGNQGEDDTYNALRSLRAAVVQDLTARGANLAVLTTITSPRPMPALALAQRVYRDSSRSSELVIEAAPIHPAFMPTSFRGLAQ